MMILSGIKHFINKKKCRNNTGFTLIELMIVLTILSILATLIAPSFLGSTDRAKEAELIFRGDAIRQAIYTYCRTARAGMTFCPKSLDDLVKAPGTLTTRRYLRKNYKDPITKGDWELIKSRNGRSVLGVRSKSSARPLKQGGFPKAFARFSGSQQYSDWVFICDQLVTFGRGAGGSSASSSPQVSGLGC